MNTVGNKKVMVYENLKRRIIGCELVPGLPINEADFASELGVSKTPVREALRQLERDGFVDNVPGRYVFENGDFQFEAGKFWLQELALVELFNEWISNR